MDSAKRESSLLEIHTLIHEQKCRPTMYLLRGTDAEGNIPWFTLSISFKLDERWISPKNYVNRVYPQL